MISHKWLFTDSLITLETYHKGLHIRTTINNVGDRCLYLMYKLDCNKNYHAGLDVNAEIDMLEKYKKKNLPQILSSINSHETLSLKQKEFLTNEAINFSENVKSI